MSVDGDESFERRKWLEFLHRTASAAVKHEILFPEVAPSMASCDVIDDVITSRILTGERFDNPTQRMTDVKTTSDEKSDVRRQLSVGDARQLYKSPVRTAAKADSQRRTNGAGLRVDVTHCCLAIDMIRKRHVCTDSPANATRIEAKIGQSEQRLHVRTANSVGRRRHRVVGEVAQVERFVSQRRLRESVLEDLVALCQMNARISRSTSVVGDGEDLVVGQLPVFALADEAAQSRRPDLSVTEVELRLAVRVEENPSPSVLFGEMTLRSRRSSQLAHSARLEAEVDQLFGGVARVASPFGRKALAVVRLVVARSRLASLHVHFHVHHFSRRRTLAAQRSDTAEVEESEELAAMLVLCGARQAQRVSWNSLYIGQEKVQVVLLCPLTPAVQPVLGDSLKHFAGWQLTLKLSRLLSPRQRLSGGRFALRGRSTAVAAVADLSSAGFIQRIY